MKKASLVWSCCAALVLSACPGPDDDKPDNPTPIDPVPTTLTVTGKVIDGSNQAVTKASILIPGNGRQPVAVDASGAFSIPNVTPPYDIIVADKEHRVATIFQGLTLKSLTVPLELDLDAEQPNDPEHQATVEGTVTGEQPSSALASTSLLFASAGTSMSGDVEPSGSYSLNLDWSGTTSVTGTIYALQSERSSIFSPPSRYLAFGQRDNVTVSKDATLSAQDIAMKPVTNSRLAGSFTVPEGYALSLITLSLAPKPASELNLGLALAPPSGAFDYAVPQIPQTTFSILAAASPRDSQDNAAQTILFKRGLTAGSTNVSLELHAPARPAQPADAAKDVTRTTGFSWSPFANGVHVIELQEDKSENQTPYKVTILTSGTQASLSDLSALGMDLPANTEFTWSVQGFGPMASVDALIGLVAQGGNPLEQGTGDLSVSTSESRTFTTAAAP